MSVDDQLSPGSPVGRGAPGPTKLVVIRGNSGSGKSAVARELRLRMGRGWALVEQDYLRRIVLREHGEAPDPIAPALIERTARSALAYGYSVILEGILDAGRYGAMLAGLHETHRGETYFCYLDVSFEETLRRHATRPQFTEFSGDDMRSWYRTRDTLGRAREHVVPETSSLAETIAFLASTVAPPGRLPGSAG